MTEKRRATLLALPTVAVLVIIVIFPMIFSLTVSFHQYDMRIQERPFIGLGNFARLLTDPDFFNAVKVTGILVVGELFFQFAFGLVIAMMLMNLPGSRKFYQPLLLIPLMVVPVVLGYTGRLIFEVRSGPINYLLNLLGFESLRWHASSELALVTIMILRVWRWTPFVMAVLLAGMLSLPLEPYDSAQVDGANGWQIFTRITLPMLKPVIMLVVVMRALDVLQTFDEIYVLTMGGPGTRTMTLSFFTYFAGFRYWDVGRASAAAWLIMIPLSILVTIFVRLMEKGERVG